MRLTALVLLFIITSIILLANPIKVKSTEVRPLIIFGRSLLVTKPRSIILIDSIHIYRHAVICIETLIDLSRREQIINLLRTYCTRA
jgi:hypothetical protein